MTDRRRRVPPPVDPLVAEGEDADRDGYAWNHYGRDAVPDADPASPAPRRAWGRRKSDLEGNVV